MSGFIVTYSGQKFFPFEPKEEDVFLGDIAHSLSNLCRYAGHSRWFYSVAQHSVLVSRILEHLGHPRLIQLAGLLHDAPEAYCVDLPSPIKRELKNYQEMELKIWKAISRKFDLDLNEDVEYYISEADQAAFATEAVQLMNAPKEWYERENFKPLNVIIGDWEPSLAKRKFLERFEELWPGYDEQLMARIK